MTEDKKPDTPRPIAKLKAQTQDPNSTMFGMPNVGLSSDATLGTAQPQLQGPGVYQLKRSVAKDDDAVPTARPFQRSAELLWEDLDLELEPHEPDATHNKQTSALIDILLDDDIWHQHTALGDAAVPLELLDRSSAADGDFELEPLEPLEPLTEVELFGGDFPAATFDQFIQDNEGTRRPEYNTNAPACTHSTNPGLEERTTPADKRYYLVCEEDGQERRVLLDAKLVELVAQLIFEPAR